jgi:hypothetical protein
LAFLLKLIVKELSHLAVYSVGSNVMSFAQPNPKAVFLAVLPVLDSIVNVMPMKPISAMTVVALSFCL